MKKIINIMTLGFFFLSLSSCLKDDSQIVKPDGVKNVVEFGSLSAPQSLVTNPIRLYSEAFNISALDTLVIPVNYAGPNMASKDINVNVEYDASIVDDFNKTEYGTNTAAYFTAINPSIVTVNDAVIKSGNNTTNLLIPIKVDQIDFKAAYVVPLVIKDASGEIISGNFNKIVVKVTPKNIYDGIYNVNGKYSDLVLGAAASARYPRDIHLITQGANTVGYFDPNLNGGIYGYTFLNNGSGSYYGNFAPIFVFDLTTGAITSVVNYYGQGTNSSRRAAQLDPSGVNKATLVNGKPTKIEVSYFMIQGGSRRLEISETFTYKGER